MNIFCEMITLQSFHKKYLFGVGYSDWLSQINQGQIIRQYSHEMRKSYLGKKVWCRLICFPKKHHSYSGLHTSIGRRHLMASDAIY